MVKTILHVDINSCFASCEQQDNPAFRYKPLAVVQDSGKRSVIIASSLEAKSYGVTTGMPIWEARRLCPHLLTAPARFDTYVAFAKKFREVCGAYSNQVEVFSIDELFIDLTETAHLFGGPRAIAWEIKRRLKEEVGDYLTCSVGIAPNKMLAKLASGSRKPDGLVVVSPSQVFDFLDSHELWHICGIGTHITARLNSLGIFTIRQMRQVPESILVREFGVMGHVYHSWAWGEDKSLVAPLGLIEPHKSYGNQLTLPKNISPEQAKSVLLWLCWQVISRLRKHGLAASTASLYISSGKSSGSACQKSPSPFMTPWDFYRSCLHLMSHKIAPLTFIRFMGVSACDLVSQATLSFPILPKEQKWQKVSTAWDILAKKYDPFYLRPARLLDQNFKKTEFNGFSKKF